MNILFIDTETTGIDPKKNGLIQIAADYHVNGESVKTFNKKLLSSCEEVDLGALKVNKNSLSSLGQLEKTASSEALLGFIDFLLAIESKDKITVAGHNVNFDLKFIEAFLAKSGIVGLGNVFNYRVIDTATIGLFLKDAGLVNWSKSGLAGLAEALDIKVDVAGLHDAEADVKLTQQVYYAMVGLLKGLKS